MALANYSKGTRLAALCVFAAHYHSGQWSRGYRLLCMAQRAWERHAGIAPRFDYWEALVSGEVSEGKVPSDVRACYAHLVNEYAESV